MVMEEAQRFGANTTVVKLRTPVLAEPPPPQKKKPYKEHCSTQRHLCKGAKKGNI